MADETTPTRPAASASKADWVTYAEAINVDASGTRDEIRARIEADEAAGTPAAEQPPAEDEKLAEDAPTAAPPAEVTFPAEPTHTFTMRPAEDEPIRAGGHVLTENGWVVEETGEPVRPAESEEDDES